MTFATVNAHQQDRKMNDLIVKEELAEWQRLKALVLDSVSSPITRWVYNMALNEFMAWFQEVPRPGFTKWFGSVRVSANFLQPGPRPSQSTARSRLSWEVTGGRFS
jgi:hypothetical protein